MDFVHIVFPLIDYLLSEKYKVLVKIVFFRDFNYETLKSHSMLIELERLELEDISDINLVSRWSPRISCNLMIS